jgi:hypothetical protein
LGEPYFVGPSGRLDQENRIQHTKIRDESEHLPPIDMIDVEVPWGEDDCDGSPEVVEPLDVVE